MTVPPLLAYSAPVPQGPGEKDIKRAFGQPFKVTDKTQGLYLADGDQTTQSWDGRTYDLGDGDDFVVTDLLGAKYKYNKDKTSVTITADSLPKGVTVQNVEGILAIQTDPKTFQNSTSTTVAGQTTTTKHPFGQEYDIYTQWPSFFRQPEKGAPYTVVPASRYRTDD